MTERTTTSDQITEEEFDALLDDLADQHPTAGAERSADAVTAATTPTAEKDGKADLISEDEFDALLDEIHDRSASGSEEDRSFADIQLPERFCIAEVESIKADFDNFFKQSLGLRIDASKVERIDTAGLQLLFAAKQYAEANDRTFTWESFSPELADTAQCIGLSSALALADIPS